MTDEMLADYCALLKRLNERLHLKIGELCNQLDNEDEREFEAIWESWAIAVSRLLIGGNGGAIPLNEALDLIGKLKKKRKYKQRVSARVPEGYVDAIVAANILGVTSRTVYVMGHRGDISSMKIGRRIFFGRNSVEEFAAKKE